MKRFHEPRVLDCAARYSRRHRENTKDNQGKTWEVTFDTTKEAREALNFGAWGLIKYWGLDPKGRRFDIEIVGDDLGKSLGQARVGILQPGQYPRYRIKLNRGTIAKRTADQIAGTIFHEMLHNIGWTHGTSGKGYEVDYAKYLIKEWGLAIAGNGTQAFGLNGDPFANWDE
jgi:hypothetical protein